MISITCDKCERALSVEDRLAGSKIACPHCGDINQVPTLPGTNAASGGSQNRPGSESLGQDRAQSPVGSASGLGSGELHVAFVRPAPFRAHPFRSGGLLLLVVAGLVGVVTFTIVNPHTTWAWVSGLVFVAALVAMGVWKLLSLAELLEVTTRRSILRRGLLSKATSEVRHEDIRNFQITQSFLERILGVGTIGISSAGQDEVEIVMRDVPNPAALRASIDKHRTLR
jgi:phage FluMu protein Com/membrane protein YdbS with pleckstrin-like domain